MTHSWNPTSAIIVAALLGGAGCDVTFPWSNCAQVLISNRLQYVLWKQKNLSTFRAFCVNETTESTIITGKTSYSLTWEGSCTYAITVSVRRGLGVWNRNGHGPRSCEIFIPQKQTKTGDQKNNLFFLTITFVNLHTHTQKKKIIWLNAKNTEENLASRLCTSELKKNI